MTVHIGFTGSREGTTEAQKQNLVDMFYADANEPVVFHHGDCLGADNDAHLLFLKTFDVMGTQHKIVIHPPKSPDKRAFCAHIPTLNMEVVELPVKDYLARDRDIVEASELLLATPKEDSERWKGGTWYTVHYAKKKFVDSVILWPDGGIEYG